MVLGCSVCGVSPSDTVHRYTDAARAAGTLVERGMHRFQPPRCARCTQAISVLNDAGVCSYCRA